jgi:DNA-binding NtrC family response regulator
MQSSFYPKQLLRLAGELAIGGAIRAGRGLAPAWAMRLVADRFAVHEDGRAFDLSTGARVTLIIGSAGGVSEQLRWTQRCNALRTLRHRAMAPLVDYGLVGESSRFEAWGCGGALRRRDDGHAVHASAARWLRACGLSPGRRLSDSLRLTGVDEGVWLPEAGAGYPEERHDAADTMPVSDRGLQILEQPAVPILAEMFHAAGARPRVSALWGAAGSGKRIVTGELARIARVNGFVPVAAPLIASRQASLWNGRTLFVIADAGDQGAWQAFLNAALTEAQPHVLLLVGEDECLSTGGVGVGRLPIDALASAVRPQALDRRLEQTVRRAAERAHGLPGRFVRLLWPAWHGEHASRPGNNRSHVSRVAEQQAVYGRREAVDDLFDAPTVACVWPAPGELAAFRRKMEGAIGHLARGRHAPGIRQLRQLIGSLARRGAWSDAARGARELAGALLRRGQARASLAAVGDGRDYAARAGEDASLVDLAVVSGHAWIDLGRLNEAESVLGTALAAACALQDPERVAAVSLASARVSYWRGDYAEAETLLTAAVGSPALRLRSTLLASRIAIGLGDLGRAMSLLSTASEQASADLDPGTRTAVAWVTAFIHFAVGDLHAVERDLSETLALARGARDSQRAMRARLLGAEVARARGGAAAALGQLHRLRRVIAKAPIIVRARWDLAKALSTPDAVLPDVVAKHVQGSGLGALGLYIAAGSSFAAPAVVEGKDGVKTIPCRLNRAAAGADPFVDDLVAILRVCQTAADEIELLKEICARLRRQLHAAAVAFVAVRGDHAHTIASDGARLETEIAERAASAGITISPHCHHDRIEAAAPIAYGGAPIGALCARWTIGSTYDTSRAGTLLTMSAAAAAPMLAAVLARQVLADAAPGELLGVTPAMAALRESVARAAAAPFGVLVDGESGSGKELVARAIHRGSARRQKAFCTLNCAALPDDLVEAELFGHARGAFTGAIADRQGVFEEAHAGTLFLDEIGELTPRAQAKVLRVIQDGELRRVGENVSRRVDVRIVSATNRALRQEVEAGRFRLDLLYRLDVVHITVPPLRERREDIALLAEHFWRDATQRVGSRATLGAATVAALSRYDWPGNVRELQNVLAALAVRTPKRGLVPPSALPPCFGEKGAAESWSLDEARRTFELSFVRAALVRTGGHRGRAAAELGVTRQGLTKLISRLGI